MVVYRGSNYEGPSKTKPLTREGDGVFIPDVASAAPSAMSENVAASAPEKTKMPIGPPKSNEGMSEEEAEYNQLLDGLGPRFVEWWSTGVLPIDADQLPPSIPGYKTPFRLLPTGMRSRLTNAEMTQMRKFAKSLPCHFALGISSCPFILLHDSIMNILFGELFPLNLYTQGETGTIRVWLLLYLNFGKKA